MSLTNVDREKLTDSLLKIQSAKATLEMVDGGKVPNAAEIDECLEMADQSLKTALGYSKRKP